MFSRPQDPAGPARGGEGRRPGGAGLRLGTAGGAEPGCGGRAELTVAPGLCGGSRWASAGAGAPGGCGEAGRAREARAGGGRRCSGPSARAFPGAAWHHGLWALRRVSRPRKGATAHRRGGAEAGRGGAQLPGPSAGTQSGYFCAPPECELSSRIWREQLSRPGGGGVAVWETTAELLSERLNGLAGAWSFLALLLRLQS